MRCPPTTTDAELTVQGNVADKSGVAEVTLNNRAVFVSENGIFTETVPLSVGENEVRLNSDGHPWKYGDKPRAGFSDAAPY